MPHSPLSTWRGIRSFRNTDFLSSYPPPPESIRPIHRPWTNSKLRIRNLAFKCPTHEYRVQSALWPFSFFTRSKKAAASKHAGDTDKEIRALKLRTATLESQLGHWKSRCTTLGEDSAALRNDVHFVKYQLSREKTDTSRTETRIKVLQGRLSSMGEMRHELTNLQSLSLNRDAQIRDLLLRLKKLESHLPLVVESNTESEDDGHEITEISSDLTKDQVKYLESQTPEVMSNVESNDGDREATQVSNKEATGDARLSYDRLHYLENRGVEYDPDSHLKYVRQVELKFGFKFDDQNHSLLWQALQYKKENIKATTKFNRVLALEGDAAFRLAVITKAIRDGRVGKFREHRPYLFPTTSDFIYESS